MTTIRPRRLGRWQRGQDAVEFALVLPLLLLIFFGVVDLGRILHATIAITNAARAGARYGSMYPADLTVVQDFVVAEAQGSGIDLSDSAISEIVVECPDGCGAGQPIRVEVTYQFQLIIAMLFEDTELPVISFAEMMIL